MTKRIQKSMALFVALAGGVGVVVQVLTVQGPIRTASIVVLFSAAILFVLMAVIPELVRLRRAAGSLPSDEELDSLGFGYTVAQATKDDIEWIAQQEALFYSADDAIPADLLREWFDANPTGFSVVKMANGQRVGHVDVLPLKARTCEKFIAGDIIEREIRGDSLFGVSERDRITCLYIESIALCVPKPLSNTAAIVEIMSSLPEIIDRVAQPERVESIYGIAATKRGGHLMRRLGFEIRRPAARRKDGHDFFAGQWITIADHARSLTRTRR